MMKRLLILAVCALGFCQVSQAQGIFIGAGQIGAYPVGPTVIGQGITYEVSSVLVNDTPVPILAVLNLFIDWPYIGPHPVPAGSVGYDPALAPGEADFFSLNFTAEILGTGAFSFGGFGSSSVGVGTDGSGWAVGSYAIPVDVRKAGDADGDGSVGFPDFLIVSNAFGSTNSPGYGGGDFNLDGNVDFEDFLILSNNYGN